MLSSAFSPVSPSAAVSQWSCLYPLRLICFYSFFIETVVEGTYCYILFVVPRFVLLFSLIAFQASTLYDYC